MSIGKIIKTGLAIYGGAVLAKKLGRYIFVKNKEKIVEKVREKILNVCDKAIDNIFKEKETNYGFCSWDVKFVTADNAYDARQRMIDIIHNEGKATVADFKDLNGYLTDISDYKHGWTDPDAWEAAPIDRFTDDIIGRVYCVTVEPPIKL